MRMSSTISRAEGRIDLHSPPQIHSFRTTSKPTSSNHSAEPPEATSHQVDFKAFFAALCNDPTLPPIIASAARKIIRGAPFQTSSRSYVTACKHDIDDEYELTYEKTPELSALVAELANCITSESSSLVVDSRRTLHLVYHEFEPEGSGEFEAFSSPSPIVGVLRDASESEARSWASVAVLMHIKAPPPNSIGLDDMHLFNSLDCFPERRHDTPLPAGSRSLLSSSNDDDRDEENILVSEALAVMTALGNRRHVLSVIVNGLKISFKYFDRAGSVQTSPLHLLYDVEEVVCAFIALSLCNTHQLGLEPSLIPMSSSPPSFTAVIGSKIVVNCNSFVIERVLHSSKSLYGRGTVVFAARTICEGGATILSNETASSAIPDVVIAKCSWQIVTQESEDEMFKIAARHGIEGITKLYASCVSDRLSTGMRGQLCRPNEYVDRELRVQIMGPLCIPLYRVTNMDHFKSAFVSLVEAHRRLYEKAGILHHDISVNNLMVDPSHPGVGVLIDLDLATRVRDGTQLLEVKPSVAGTTPFLSIDLLREQPPIRPLYRHDLESFLYVLSWIVVHYRDGQFVPSDMLRTWSRNGDTARPVKRGFLCEPHILIRKALIGSPLEAWIIELATYLMKGIAQREKVHNLECPALMKPSGAT